MSERIKTIIMGAAGRDFHNFNTLYRENERYEVICFTATQIPDIEGRVYPSALSGSLYPEGISIVPEEEIDSQIVDRGVEEVVFSYSDVSHEYVMHQASRVTALGAHFKLLGVEATMLPSSVPVVSICAARTGSGKSQTTRKVAALLQEHGKRVVIVRHPMPYGDLVKQRCQRFASIEDLKAQDCTIEEMEEYEPHIVNGSIVYAGVDYQEILESAQAEADVVLWDGGNNDTPFFHSDLEIVVVDPHRPGHEYSYYPGETNVLRADVLVINKIDTADPDDVLEVREALSLMNPDAVVVDAASPIYVEDADAIRDKRVLVVEDGPTLTHGEMTYGAGTMAAEKFGAAELVDPRPFVVGSIAETFEEYPDIGVLLPAMGYGEQQVRDLEETINRSDAEVVVSGTPIDLGRIVKSEKPILRVRYELQEIGHPTLSDVIGLFVEGYGG